ncbi:MAG TPA: IPT/TIG domain-containing protein, partial [Polyangiaceae bacterium]|nr:IPT/TIG domain-containing protein [Polyangiaceae bacterium]
MSETPAPTEAAAEPGAPKDEQARPEIPAPPPMMGAPGPIISALRPIVASSHGGTKMAIYGSNFVKGCRVLVSGKEIKNPWFVNDTLIKVEAPALPAGPADIILENPDGKRANVPFTYDDGPTVERFSPLEGSPHGGTEILVEGKNFQEGCGITFFGRHAPEVTFISPTVLKFTTPPHEDSFHGEVCVTNPDGLATVAEELFTYRLATPEVHDVSPATGLVDGSKRILVKGVDFHPKCTARLGGVAASITWKGAGSLELITPRAEAPGPAALEIENPDGQIGKLEAAFTYLAAPTPPILVEVKPDRGYCAGGQLIQLYGNNFEEDTIVRVGEMRAVTRFVSRRQIEIQLPPCKQPGPVAVELTDRHGVVVRREEGFLYESRPAPRVDGVTPRNGPMVGGTKLVIEGDYFDDHIYVRIGGVTPKFRVVRGTTRIETVAPPSREAGHVDVEVGRGDAGLFVAKKAFRYDASPPPAIESVAPNKGSVDGGTDVSIEGKGFVADSVVLFGRT